MSYFQKLYDQMPVPVQNLLVSLSGFSRNLSRYGLTYDAYRNFLKDFDTWSLEGKLEYQRRELIRLIRYASRYSKFYRELYRGIPLQRIQSIDDLKMLPVVDKEMLRKNIDDVVTVKRTGAVEGHTGGTTGKSLVVLFTRQDKMKRMAMLDHFKARVGFENRKMKRATFNGKHIIPPKQKKNIYWRYNAACRQMIYSSFHLTEENMQYYVDSLNRFKPHALDGFFTSLCDIASYMERHGIEPLFTPAAIFPTSETVTPQGRELLERVFHARVYDQYASSEGAPFVTECPHHALHMELASGVFEHLDENGGEILVTSFTTYGTPLIRYRIGDAMHFEDPAKTCSCGCEGPLVSRIEGRSMDFLYTAKGARINGGNVANLFKNIPNAIIRAQIIQEKMDALLVKLEVDKKLYLPEYDEQLRREILHKFGAETEVLIEHVDDLPREASGKFRMIQNKLCCRGDELWNP